MRARILLATDCFAVILATLAALILRENFQVSAAHFIALVPYIVATIAVAAPAFSLAGLNQAIWRYSTLPDFLRVTGVMAATVGGAVGLAFAYNRLDGVARSLPILQFLTGTALLLGVRVIHRLGHEFSHRRKASAALLQASNDDMAGLTILIVGISRLAEVYLQAVSEMAPGQIRIAGLMGRADRHAGRLVATHPVLGTPESVESVLDSLEVHGVCVDRIVVAVAFKSLSPEARNALVRVERSRSIELRLLAEDLDLDFEKPGYGSRAQDAKRGPGRESQSFEVPPDALQRMARKPYWAVKRFIDCFGSLFLFVFLFPLIILTGVLIAGSLGTPVLFWQQRPGLGGRPFRLYKFRTMRAAHSEDGRRLQEHERASRLGNALRRLRVDEAPQLLNILRGEMSFVGPRPLLPRDQSEDYRARLLVRPGLTGWAQVVGGRDITPEDKAVLDVWYVRNASLALDIEIAFRTLFVLFFGERISIALIERAWRDLSAGGVLGVELESKLKNGLHVVYPRV